MSLQPVLQEFHSQLQGRVRTRASSSFDGESLEEQFTQECFDALEDFEVIDNPVKAYRNQGGVKANGFALREDRRALDLFITEFSSKEHLETTGQKRIDWLAEKAKAFLHASQEGLHRNIDVSSPAHEMARAIFESRETLETVRIFILTNTWVQRASLDPEDVGKLHVTFQIWDVARFHKVENSKKGREEVQVDLAETPITALVQDEGDLYVTYLAIVPATVLARIYDEHGLRLLEHNVRAYLQVRPVVNKGISETLRYQPELFLTYNNGLAGIADAVKEKRTAHGTIITGITDFQIVNGGQTTASIHRAVFHEGLDVSRAKVQLKLTVLKDPAAAADIVPRISQYSNTQNKIDMADFASNDPFHLELARLSRKIPTTMQAGSRRGTYWFYERIRREYETTKGRIKGPAERRDWVAENPESQIFDKIELAQVSNAWDGFPHKVAQGKQKNFSFFTERTKTEAPVVNDQYYRDLIARLIVWKRVLTLVRRNTPEGHKTNTTAYLIAWLVRKLGGLDLQKVWQRPELEAAFDAEIMLLAAQVHHYLTHPDKPVNYIQEWHKKEETWIGMQDLPFTLSENFAKTWAAQGKATVVGAVLLSRLRQYGSDWWLQLAAWGGETAALSPQQIASVRKVAAALQAGKDPRPADATRGSQALEIGLASGFAQTVTG